MRKKEKKVEVKHNKFFIFAIIIFLILIVAGLFIQQKIKITGLVTQSFIDVPTTYWAYSQIEAVYREGITGGCITDPPKYCPTDLVKRYQMAVFLVRAMNETLYNKATPTFADVPKTHSAYSYIERVYQLGITSGCKTVSGKKYYCPSDNLTRAEMAVFLSRAAGIPTNNPTTPTFADVPKTNSAYIYIEGIYKAGITSGCVSNATGRYYCPSNFIKRDEMAVFITKTFLTQIQGYVQEQKTDGSVSYISDAEVLDQNNRNIGISISSPLGSFTTQYLKKGNYELRAKKSPLIPLIISIINLDYGWKYSGNKISLSKILRIGQPSLVEGYATDFDSGNLIANAIVKTESRNLSKIFLNSAQTTTDSNGYFNVSTSSGNITMTASKINYTLKNPINFSLIFGENITNKELILIPNSSFVEGYIKTDTGEPLSASIVVPAAFSFYNYELVFDTDWTGYYKAYGIKPKIKSTDTFNLTIYAADFWPQNVRIPSPGARQTAKFNFTFFTQGTSSMIDTRPGSFSARATDINGNAISDAYVVLSNGEGQFSGENPDKYYKKTAADGSIDISNIPDGIYSIYIFKDLPDGTTIYYSTPEYQVFIEHGEATQFDLSSLEVIATE